MISPLSYNQGCAVIPYDRRGERKSDPGEGDLFPGRVSAEEEMRSAKGESGWGKRISCAN